MATMTRQATSFAGSRPPFVTTAARVTLFWFLAAIGVGAAHLEIDPLWPAGGGVAGIAIIVICAYWYTRYCARNAGISHALGVGIAWLVLGVVTEMILTADFGHGSFDSLGSPTHPLLRTLFLFAWIFAPALFAQREDA